MFNSRCTFRTAYAYLVRVLPLIEQHIWLCCFLPIVHTSYCFDVSRQRDNGATRFKLVWLLNPLATVSNILQYVTTDSEICELSANSISYIQYREIWRYHAQKMLQMRTTGCKQDFLQKSKFHQIIRMLCRYFKVQHKLRPFAGANLRTNQNHGFDEL